MLRQRSNLAWGAQHHFRTASINGGKRRFGSKADMAMVGQDGRFAPESGHCQRLL
jgi:hypothetical protein